LAEKKAYPLRISSDVLEAVQRWAEDELRSVNAQIEYVLRDALRKAGRMKPDALPSEDETIRTRTYTKRTKNGPETQK
jgi:hypothetical protein